MQSHKKPATSHACFLQRSAHDFQGNANHVILQRAPRVTFTQKRRRMEERCCLRRTSHANSLQCLRRQCSNKIPDHDRFGPHLRERHRHHRSEGPDSAHVTTARRLTAGSGLVGDAPSSSPQQPSSTTHTNATPRRTPPPCRHHIGSHREWPPALEIVSATPRPRVSPNEPDLPVGKRGASTGLALLRLDLC